MKPKKKPTRALRHTDDETSFREVVGLIEQAREHALRTVNTVLIDLYWRWANTSAESLKRLRGAKVS